MPRTLVVHASNLLARGFLTSAPDRTRGLGGEPTNALFAATRALRTAIGFKTPERAVAVVEAEPGEAPPKLASQRARLEELMEAHGIACVTSAPARHAVAAYVRAATELGDDVVVVGSDKRLAQLVSDRVWWYDAYKDARYTPEMVRKRFEVGPELVDQWLALVGDDDAMPGIKGIGKKGATTLLATYGSVEAALADVASIKGRTGNALRAAGVDAVRLELSRGRLDAAVEPPRPVAELAYQPAPEAARQALYAELGFLELLTTARAGEGIDVALFDDDAAVAAALESTTPLALHGLFTDPSPVRGSIVGLAWSAAGGPAGYAPLEGREVPASLRVFLEDASRPKVGHDVKSVVVGLARRGIALRGVVGDAACASHLHEPSNLAPQDLPILTKHYLRRALPEEDELRGVGRGRRSWAAVEPSRAAAFAGAYAEAAAAVFDHLQPTTDPDALAEYMALSDTLVRVELRGIAVDADDLDRAGDDFTRIGAELEGEIHALAGRPFNINSTKQLGAVLFEDLGLEVVSRTKTGWSTATHALERIESAHPIVSLVIRWRRLRRLKDTWVTALKAAIDPDGRVRSTFSPTRSFSGRLVNSAPDLGRVPGKTAEMIRIRHAFAAPLGRALLSVDYEQLGLYVLAHLTRDPALVEPLRERADMHALTAAAVLEVDPGALTKDQRQLGKVVNFATFAGQGASALRMQLGISPKEAKRYIARFNRRYAVARAFQDEQLRLAQERGYVTLISGRPWPIGGLRSLDAMARSYAERLARRATHEGSVADVSRRGLLHADRALREAGIDAAPLLQVHDEVLFEVAEGEVESAARVAAEAMRRAYALEVPLRVGCKAGPNWAELTPLPSDAYRP